MSGRNVRVSPARRSTLQGVIGNNIRLTKSEQFMRKLELVKGVDGIKDPAEKEKFLDEFESKYGYSSVAAAPLALSPAALAIPPPESSSNSESSSNLESSRNSESSSNSESTPVVNLSAMDKYLQEAKKEFGENLEKLREEETQRRIRRAERDNTDSRESVYDEDIKTFDTLKDEYIGLAERSFDLSEEERLLVSKELSEYIESVRSTYISEEAVRAEAPPPPPIVAIDPQKVYYDPRTGDPLSSPDDAIKQLEHIIREIKASHNQIPSGLYGLNNKTSSYSFLLNVFCNPAISLDDMVTFALEKGGNPGSDIYEVLCRLYVFFGGVKGVNPRKGGNYKFMKKIEEAGERFDTTVEALKSIKCKATSVTGISDITLVHVGGTQELSREAKATDPYCEVDCKREGEVAEQIQTYLISVKWYKKEKSAEHYDLEKLFVAANKITTAEQQPVGILVFLKSKEDFRIAHSRAYRQYVKGLADNFLGWKEDVKPFLQDIRREIFEGAQQRGMRAQDLLVDQYLGVTSKPPLNLYLHQDIIVKGMVDSFGYSVDNRYVIGVLPRGGKTNIAGGIMREYLKRNPKKPLNIFWITAAPTETRTQVSNDLLTKYQDFDDFEFKDAVRMSDLETRPKKHAVWFISNNLLTQHKGGRSKSRDFLSSFISGKDSLGLVFFDEAHAGGSGDQTSSAVKEILDNYEDTNLPLIFLTATYYSIVLDYQIVKDNIFIWDYTDVLKTRALGTESEREEAIANLKRRFGGALVQSVLDRRLKNNDTYETMSKPYLDYPDLLFITAEFQEEAKARFEAQNMYRPFQGFDMGSIFALRNNLEQEKLIDPLTGRPKGQSWRSRLVFTGDSAAPVRRDAWKAFENLEHPRNMIALLTPQSTEQTFEDQESPGGQPLTQSEEDARRGIEPSILARIDKLSKSNDSRFRLDERPTIMMFMPVGGIGSSIEHLLPAWASLLMNNSWWSSRYEVACVVGGGGLTEVPEDGVIGGGNIHLIDSSNTKARLMELERLLHCGTPSKGLVVLTGKMLSMGVSLPCTDVVMLLNDGKSPDDIIQKMYRALTPSKGKTAAFVVDLNPVRTLAAAYGYTRASHEGTNSPSEILDIITDVYSWDADMYGINISSGKDSQAPRPLDFQARMKLLLEQAEADPAYRVAEDIGGFEKKVAANIQKHMGAEFAGEITRAFTDKIDRIKKAIRLKEGASISLQKGRLIIRKPKEPKENNSSDEEDSQESEELIIENFAEAVNDFIKYLALTSSKMTLNEALEEFEESSEIDPKYGTSLQGNVGKLIMSRSDIKGNISSQELAKLLAQAVKELALQSSTGVFRQMKGKTDDKTVRKDKILELIHKRLTPRQKQKKEAGEVFTPIELIEKVMAHLPKSIWKNPDLKWIDPANGIGNFPVVIFYKLDEGLKEWEPSEKKRRKHIIENMLYMIELQSNNNRIARKIFETLCEGCKPNILTANSVELTPAKLKAKGFPEKYDIVMGNPPFQKGRNMMFYVYFIDLANKIIKENGYLLYVIPNKILIPNKANEAIKHFNPLFIYHTVNKDFLPTIISTTICAVICKKEAFDKETKVEFDNGEMIVDLETPTPTQYNDIKLKEISDKILFGKDIKYLSTSREKPANPHLYISRVWMRYSPDKPDGGGSHIFKISDEPAAGDDGSGKYITIPDGITKSLLVWVLSRSEAMRFITKIYAGAMNVPAFIWDIIPFIPVKSEADSEVYRLLHLDASDIKTIKDSLKDNIQADADEPAEGGVRNYTRRKSRN